MGTTLILTAAACRSAPVTIRAGLLLDGRGGQMRDALVTIVGGRITAVAPWRAGPVTWDLSRFTVLPGLIDAHVHISGYITRRGVVSGGDDGETPAQHAAGRAANALATLRAGFTTVASMGNDVDRELRDLIAAGRIPGPRILTSLVPIQDTSLTPDQLRKEVRSRKSAGADFIKIFASATLAQGGAPVFSDAQLAALCGEARRLGLRSVVHAYSDASLRQVAAAGCTEVEHGSFATADGLGALAARGVFFDPQCALILRNYLEHWSRYAEVPGYDSTRHAVLERLLPVFPRLIGTARAVPGLTVLYGTDAVAGAHGRNAEDLLCRVREAGEPPMEALVAATSRNAAALGLGDQIGTVGPGYRADLIALDGNPLEDISAVQRVRFVMKGGMVFVRP